MKNPTTIALNMMEQEVRFLEGIENQIKSSSNGLVIEPHLRPFEIARKIADWREQLTQEIANVRMLAIVSDLRLQIEELVGNTAHAYGFTSEAIGRALIDAMILRDEG